MIRNSNCKGFTLLEVIVALSIMTIGFLAMSQMQYISVLQKTAAENGTFATHLIEGVSGFEIASAKRVALLNAKVYLDSQASITITTQDDYCDNSTDAVCAQCPCNPMQSFSSDTFNFLQDGVEVRCAPVDTKNFKIKDIQYFDNINDCSAVTDDINPSFFIIRRVANEFDNTVTPNQVNSEVTYAIKSVKQLKDADNGFELDEGGESGALAIKKSLAVQRYEISGHVERDWTNFVTLGGGTWNEVIVPHIP